MFNSDGGTARADLGNSDGALSDYAIALERDPTLKEVRAMRVGLFSRSGRKDDAVVAETIRIAVRRAADQIWGKKPVCKVLVQRA